MLLYKLLKPGVEWDIALMFLILRNFDCFFLSLSLLTKQRFTFEIFRHRDIDAQTVGYKNSEHFMWLSNGLRCAIFGLDFSVWLVIYPGTLSLCVLYF